MPDNLNYTFSTNIYSTLNNGWETFTFYCPDEYTECLNDVDKISKNINNKSDFCFTSPLITYIPKKQIKQPSIKFQVIFSLKNKLANSIVIGISNLKTIAVMEESICFKDTVIPTNIIACKVPNKNIFFH